MRTEGRIFSSSPIIQLYYKTDPLFSPKMELSCTLKNKLSKGVSLSGSTPLPICSASKE